MNLLYPELLLLAIPLGFLLWKTSPWPSLRMFWRFAISLCILVAIAGPHSGGVVSGRDLVLVIDRSRSMPGGGIATVEELVRISAASAEVGDRISLLTFASDTGLEQAPSANIEFDGFTRSLDLDGSNLTAALEQALAMIPKNRPGSILLYSDGEFHGSNPDSVSRRAAARGIRIDVRSVGRPTSLDVAVEGIELPEQVEVGEPFQFSAWVRSGQATSLDYTLYRGSEVIGRGKHDVRIGLNRLIFRDMGRKTGIEEYRLKVELDNDPILANNQGTGVMRVAGNRPLLLINSTGTVGRLANALRSAGLDTQVFSPEQLPMDRPEWLEGFRGIILEDLSASSLGPLLPAIASQVSNLGTGLLITGGRSSFGVGGYYRSALDLLLPVSMEVRVEHRKMGLSLVVVLDRSGSMAATVGGGMTKMDLANIGTMEAIRLLSPMDEIAVIAVDTNPHVVVPRSPVDDPGAFTSRVNGIQSMGGGIFTYTGLVAAANELRNTARQNRHIVLFADADDAEEPGRYQELLAGLKDDFNTTVSVVALGTAGNSDAAFLQDVALRGGGEIYFTENPNEIPRLFAQDTLLSARSSFIEEPSPTAVTTGMLAIADMRPGAWQTLPGYNLCYLRPGASLGIRTTDSYASPVIATMQAGLGRTAAFTGQVSGNFQVSDANWPEVANSLVTLARWISAQAPPQIYFTNVRREGREAVISIDIDRTTEVGGNGAGSGILKARMVAPDGTASDLPLVPVSADRLEARVPIGLEGVYRFAAATEDGKVLELSPLAVSYSPEFEPRFERDSGDRVLGRIARLSSGRMNPAGKDLFRGDRSGRAWKPLAMWFVLAGLLLLLCEIAWRRFLEGSVRLQTKRSSVKAMGKAKSDAGTKQNKTKSASVKTTHSRLKSEPISTAAPKKEVDLGDALNQAKQKAKRRTDQS